MRGIKSKSKDRIKQIEKLIIPDTLVYKCELCGMQVNSLFQLKEHFKGKRHLINAVEVNSKGSEAPVKNIGYDARIVTASFLFVWISIVLYFYTLFVIIDKFK